MTAKPTRVAIYLRVSTDDQHAENQLLQFREFCERWESRAEGSAERMVGILKTVRVYQNIEGSRFSTTVA